LVLVFPSSEEKGTKMYIEPVTIWGVVCGVILGIAYMHHHRSKAFNKRWQRAEEDAERTGERIVIPEDEPWDLTVAPIIIGMACGLSILALKFALLLYKVVA
jgi:hypothetical protein